MAIQIRYAPRVGRAGLPGVRQGGSNIVAQARSQAAEGIERAATGLGQLHQQVRDEQDAAALHEAYTRLAQTKHMYLDDPSNGFTSRKGKTAGEERNVFLKSFDDDTRKIVETLGNERQKANFAKLLGRERQSYVESLDNHTAREADAYAQQAHEGALSAAQSSAAGAAARGELDKVQEAIANGLGAIDQRAKAKGWAPGFAEAQRKGFETAAHLGAIETMLEQGRGAEARAYMAAARRHMDAAAIAKSNIDKALTASAQRDEAAAAVSKAWAETGGDPAAALDLVRSTIQDPTTRDEAVQQVAQLGAQKAAVRRQADAPRLGRLEQELLTRGGFTQASDDFQRLSDEGKADALRMLRAEQRARRERGSKERDAQREHDRYLLAYFDGLDLVGEKGADKLTIDVDGGDFLDGSPTLREQVRARQKAAQRQVAKDNGVSAQEFRQQFDAALAGQKIDKKKADRLRKYANGQYSRWLANEKNAGIPPPQDVVDKWVGDWFTTVDLPWYTGGDERAIDLEMEAAETQPLPAAPAPPPPGRVRVRKADGSTGSVPSDKVEAFLAANPGATVTQ